MHHLRPSPRAIFLPGEAACSLSPSTVDLRRKVSTTAPDSEQTISTAKIGKRLSLFFPDSGYTPESVAEGVDVGDILHRPQDILLFLQTALLDEKLIEVEFDNYSRIFFTRIHDDPPSPETVENEDGSKEVVEADYRLGDYLKKMTYLVTLPVEPGIGNLHICWSKRVLMRFFTSSYAVELGVYFEEKIVVGEIPVLRVSFPGILRIVRGAREYRAKVPADVTLTVKVKGKRKRPDMLAAVSDISARGLSFALEKEQQELLQIDEKRTLTISLNGDAIVRVAATVRHVSKTRRGKGIEYICGVQFDLETRTMAAQIESLVATIQRAHLKELSDLSDKSGLTLFT